MGAVRKVSDWLDERTGWRESLGGWVDRRAAGAPWATAISAAILACLAVLALTGVVLMTAYAPSPQSAWASVHYVQYVQDRGWVVRGLHHWAAQALLVLAATHVAHGALAAGYRKPRELAWWLTLLVLALAVGEGITGGLLPWDQHGWWARVVEGNILGMAPVVGAWLQQMMMGGTELGALGLARAYTMHVVLLPLLLALVLFGRGVAVRRLATVVGASAERASPRSRLLRDVLLAALMVIVLFALTGATRGAPLDAPADPMSDYPARPEWFLLPLFQLRKFFHGVGEFWGTSLLPFAAATWLALLPWVDRPGRSRGAVLAPVALILAGTVVMGVLPWRKDARDPQYAKQRAKADARAASAVELAMNGVPPAGALEMVRQDPELRGRDLFDQHCASCHVLGDLGDPKKAVAAKLDGWTTAEWIAAMVHDPDSPRFFGRGPYKGRMPSADVRPADKPAAEPWSAMVKTAAEMHAVATFLASQGDEPGEPPSLGDDAARAQGEKMVSERCSTCHLYKGQGDDEDTGLAPELSHYGSIAWTRAQVANPASRDTYREKALDESMKKHMPRFDKDLSPGDVDVVARWTRAHARGLPVH